MVGIDQWKEISTNFLLEATNCQVFMIFSAKVDRFRDAVNIEEKKTESNSAKKAQKPERDSAVAAMRERADESKSILPEQKIPKSAVAASTQASEPAQDEKVYKSAVAASAQASEPAQDEKVYKSAVAESTQASEPAQDEKVYKSAVAESTQASEPAQDEKVYKSAVAASTQASEPAQDEKMNTNNVISKANKAEENFSEITEEDNEGDVQPLLSVRSLKVAVAPAAWRAGSRRPRGGWQLRASVVRSVPPTAQQLFQRAWPCPLRGSAWSVPVVACEQ
jgi:hypothetical protein